MNPSVATVGKSILTILLALCTTVLSAQNVPSYVPTNGLVGWWPFNGNANDESGNGYDGVVNGADLTTDRKGTLNSAYSFNGATDYISIADDPDFAFLLNDSYTINFYVRLNTQPDPNNQYSSQSIISHGDYDACCQDRGWVVWLGNGTGEDQGIIYEARGNGGDPTTTSSNHASAVLNTWTMVTVSRTYGTNCRIYIDGDLIEENVDIAGLADPFTEERNIIIGALAKGRTQDNPNPGDPLKHYLNGKVDDLAIWSRVLNESEIANLYQECGDINITTQPLAASVTSGDITSLTVSATSVNLMSYQWQFDSGSGFQNLSNGSAYSGVTSSTLTINDFSENSAGTYRCVISTTVCDVTSNGVTLTLLNPASSYVPQDDLAGWWPLDGNPNDQSGNNRHFTNYGATVTTDRFGATNKAYQYDGVDDYMRVDIDQSAAFSISAWVYLESDNRVNGLFQYKYPCIRGGGTVVGGSYGKLGSVTIACGQCLPYTCNNWSGERTNLFNLGKTTWRHIVLTVDGVDKFRLYVDGVLINTYTKASLITNYSNLPLIIGKVQDENPGYHLGKIDEVGLWNRALTSTEIMGLYESLAITNQPSGVSVAGGQSTTLSVSATTTNGAGLTYRWQRHTGSGYTNITDGPDYSGTATQTLTIKSARVSQAGPFRCVISTPNTSVLSNTASLTVTCPCNN